MGYYLQKLADEAGKPTRWQQMKGGLSAAKDKAVAFGTSVKSKAADIGKAVKDKAVAGGTTIKNKAVAAGKYVAQSKPGQWVRNNPKKSIGGAAGTAAALGLFAGRNKIKKALGSDD